MPDKFTGFPQSAFQFFEQLALNNNRDWFRANQEWYERDCREPMRLLVSELHTDPEKSKILRINRDVRFSRDKSPYRTYIAAGVRGAYIRLSAEGIYIGVGIYKPEPAALGRLRDAIDNDASGKSLQRIVASFGRKGYEIESHARLATAPRGYTPDHPRIELLRMKDIFAGKSFGPEPWLSSRRALSRITRVIDDVRPLADWLRVHVGARS
jgi:uncharacterized protein (TIGR02453 family)